MSKQHIGSDSDLLVGSRTLLLGWIDYAQLINYDYDVAVCNMSLGANTW